MTQFRVRSLTFAILAAVVSLVSVGCQPVPAPSPTPSVVGTGPTGSATPTPECTPSPGAAPTPCSATQYAEQQKGDALYAEAEKVLRDFLQVDARFVRDGLRADDDVLRYLAGPFRDAYVSARKEQAERGITIQGDYRLAYVRRATSPAGGGETSLEYCLDGTEAIGYKNGKALGPDGIRRVTATFKHVDGSLRIWDQSGGQVATC